MTTAMPTVTEIEKAMIRLARNHIALHGYPTGDQAVTRLIHVLQAALPVARPVEVHQPGKSAKAQAARVAALERSPAPVVPAVGKCGQGACSERASGWRLYVHGGWEPVCGRHMGGAKALARRSNLELGAAR